MLIPPVPNDIHLHTVADLVRQRFRFAQIIYYHQTEVAASTMLAKVFALVGKPEEVDKPLRLSTVDNVRDLTERLIQGDTAPSGLSRNAFHHLGQNHTQIHANLGEQIGTAA